jgi:hypothetical protein
VAKGGRRAAGRLRTARGSRLQQVEAVAVVRVRDLLPLDALVRVQLLLLLEGVHDEVLLQLLVGVIDAQLLERVELKHLEAVDVEDADEGRVDVRLRRVGGQAVVDPADKPREEPRVHHLGDRVARVLRLHHAQRHRVRLLPHARLARHERARRHHLLEVLRRHAQQRRRRGSRRHLRVAREARAVALLVLREAHRAQVQQRAQDLEGLPRRLVVEPARRQRAAQVAEVRRVQLGVARARRLVLGHEVREGRRVLQRELLPELAARAGGQLAEDVVAALARRVLHQPRLL